MGGGPRAVCFYSELAQRWVIARGPKPRAAAAPPPRGGRTYTCSHPGVTAATLRCIFDLT